MTINDRGRCHVWDCIPILLVVVLQALASGCSPNWQEYTSAEGRFLVLMPDSPTEERSVKQTTCGTMKVVSLDTVLNKHLVFATRGFYSVSYSDFGGTNCPAEDARRVLDEERDDAVKNLGGKLVEERDLTDGDRIGREIQVRTPRLGLVRERIYVVDRRVYRVIVGGKTEASSEDARRFLESFRVLSQAPTR